MFFDFEQNRGGKQEPDVADSVHSARRKAHEWEQPFFRASADVDKASDQVELQAVGRAMLYY